MRFEFATATRILFGPGRKSLDQFLAGLPQLWRSGEARPTHRKEEPEARYWRTRADPFKNVWTDILLGLQKEPNSIAKVMLQKLNDSSPPRRWPFPVSVRRRDRYPRTQLKPH